jgi:hypothetical protein
MSPAGGGQGVDLRKSVFHSIANSKCNFNSIFFIILRFIWSTPSPRQRGIKQCLTSFLIYNVTAFALSEHTKNSQKKSRVSNSSCGLIAKKQQKHKNEIASDY